MIQSFVSMGWTTVIWFVVGYSLCFSGGAGGIIGNLDKAFLNGVTLTSPSALNSSIPEFVFVAYQMMFAIITPALITGAFANRVTFKAYMIFLTAWLLFVYFPFVHMIWGGGLLATWGVLDFAGGIVVHNMAGIAALASVLYVGRRAVTDRGPHSIPLVALGTGLLWFGWYGFNAGREFRVDATTAVAFLNTDVAASFRGHGLAVRGLVLREAAELPGLAHRRGRRARHDHPGGRLRLASRRPASSASSRAWSATAPWRSRTGFTGTTRSTSGASMGWAASWASSCSECSPRRLSTRMAPTACWRATRPSSCRSSCAVILSSVWAFGFTYGMLWLIDRVTPVHVTPGVEETGLDAGLHHEEAYLGGAI